MLPNEAQVIEGKTTQGKANPIKKRRKDYKGENIRKTEREEEAQIKTHCHVEHSKIRRSLEKERQHRDDKREKKRR